MNIDEAIAVLDRLSTADCGGDELARVRLRAAARRLVARVETPFETASALCFEHPVIYAALQTGVDLGLWEAWGRAGGGKRSVEDLAKLSPVPCEMELLSDNLSWTLSSDDCG